MTTTSQADLGGSNALNNGSVGVGGSASNCSTNSVSKNLNINNGTSSSNNNNNNNNNNILNNGVAGVGGVSGNSHHHATETTKQRKKLKSRNAANLPHSGYGKDHLDAWLDTCLKDASNAQLSSSSEFLDYNPTPTTHANNPNKSFFVAQQQQQQQQQQSPVHQQSQPVQFPMRTSTSFSGNQSNALPFSQGFQRGIPNFMKHTQLHNNRYSMLYPSVANGCFYAQNDGAQDFTSLPPIVNMLGGGGGGFSEHGNNSTDVLDGSGSNPNISRGFRFSDPCLLNPSDNDSKISENQQTPPPSTERRNQSASTEMEQNKFFSALMEQINLLHEANTKICRNLHETKVDIEALKHAPNWGMRHRRDSLSGLSTHSQPLIFGGGGFGAQSPAPTFHSGAYTPGLMTDVVREVKDAARVREDALLNRVKSMVEERQWSTNESHLRLMRDIEDLKSQIHHLRADRKEANKRLTHLESENKYMRQMLAAIFNNRHAPQPDIIYENEALRTRRHQQQHHHHNQPTQHRRMNLQYATNQHHQTTTATVPIMDETTKRLSEEEPLHINETSSIDSIAIAAAPPTERCVAATDMRHSFSSSDGSAGLVTITSTPPPLINGNVPNVSEVTTPPKFALISTANDERQRDNLVFTNKVSRQDDAPEQMRRELNDAVVSRRQADERIIALEKLVRNLQVNVAPAKGGGVSGGGGGCGYTNTISPGFFTSAASTSSPHVLKWQPSDTTASVATSPQTLGSRNEQHQTFSITTSNSTNAPKLSVLGTGPITDL